MNRQQALNQLRIMRDWHEDFGNGPCPDYDAICYAINIIEAQPKELDTLIKALEQEHKKLREMQKALPEIIYCKDCAKHNKDVGDFEELPDGRRSWIWKDQACPLVSWRGKSQEHEFDYQYCAFAERRTDG